MRDHVTHHVPPSNHHANIIAQLRPPVVRQSTEPANAPTKSAFQLFVVEQQAKLD